MLVSQSCLTLCDPMDCSRLGPSVHEILQARIPQWFAISFSGDPVGEIRIGHLKSKGAPPGMFITRAFLSFVKHFWLPDCLIMSHTEAIALLILTYLICIPKIFPSGQMKYFSHFCKTQSTKTQKMQTISNKKMVQDRFQHQCIQMNWPPTG